jgi:hypothetical protein
VPNSGRHTWSLPEPLWFAEQVQRHPYYAPGSYPCQTDESPPGRAPPSRLADRPQPLGSVSKGGLTWPVTTFVAADDVSRPGQAQHALKTQSHGTRDHPGGQTSPRTQGEVRFCCHPCPCGWHADPVRECTRSYAMVSRYQKRISSIRDTSCFMHLTLDLILPCRVGMLCWDRRGSTSARSGH